MCFLFSIAITCGRLESPTNGKVIVTGTTPGSVATYSCNSGFELIGNERRRSCQNNGQWGGNAPVCRGNRNKVMIGI